MPRVRWFDAGHVQCAGVLADMRRWDRQSPRRYDDDGDLDDGVAEDIERQWHDNPRFCAPPCSAMTRSIVQWVGSRCRTRTNDVKH